MRSAFVVSRQCRNRPAASPSGRRPSTWWISSVNDTRSGPHASVAAATIAASPAGPYIVARAFRPSWLNGIGTRMREVEVVGQAAEEGMPVVQVEVQMLAEPPDRARHVEHVMQHARYGILDVREQAGQALIAGAETAQAEALVIAREPGRGLPGPDVAHVNAAADPI